MFEEPINNAYVTLLRLSHQPAGIARYSVFLLFFLLFGGICEQLDVFDICVTGSCIRDEQHVLPPSCVY